MTTLAYRYHRFSTKSQDKGSSIERQDEVTLAMVKANGFRLLEVEEILSEGVGDDGGRKGAVAWLDDFRVLDSSRL